MNYDWLQYKNSALRYFYLNSVNNTPLGKASLMLDMHRCSKSFNLFLVFCFFIHRISSSKIAHNVGSNCILLEEMSIIRNFNSPFWLPGSLIKTVGLFDDRNGQPCILVAKKKDLWPSFSSILITSFHDINTKRNQFKKTFLFHGIALRRKVDLDLKREYELRLFRDWCIRMETSLSFCGFCGRKI